MAKAPNLAAATTNWGRLESLLDPATLAAVRRVKELEERHWSVGFDVTLSGDSKLSGRKGLTCGYDEEGRTFKVEVEGEDVQQFAAEDLLFDLGDERGLEGPALAEATAEEAALEAARRYFRPGSRFEGTITIPGAAEQLSPPGDDCDEEPQEYMLQVVSETTDEMGDRLLLVRHEAYGDEQACYATFTVTPASPSSPPKAKISYKDCETSCEGTIEVDAAGNTIVRGRVRQYVQGEEGFYEPSKEDTHVFELTKVTACDAEAAHSRRLEAARERRVDALCAWLQSPECKRGHADPLDGDRQMTDSVFWDAMNLLQAQSAKLRRQSGLLNALVFKCAEEKASRLAGLRASGLHRAGAHAANDAAMMRLKLLVRVCSTTPMLEHECIKAHSRLARSYASFDLSMRTAEARLAKDVLQRWLRGRDSEGEATDETPCAVCFLPLHSPGEDDEETVQLPCAHRFHFGCVSQWLHSHTTCPNCRMELTPEGPGDGLPDPADRGSRRSEPGGAER